MATTFTGLKLQGYLGKFGRVEISDISAYVELPDGKVLSGTEWGNLLLWDGGFIKVEISRKGKKFCHNVRGYTVHCISLMHGCTCSLNSFSVICCMYSSAEVSLVDEMLISVIFIE